MKVVLKNVQTIVIFMIIWIILFENVRPFTLITGIFISIFTLRVTNGLLKMNYAEEFYAPPVAFFMYFFMLIKDIYVSGFDMLGRILKGKVTPSFTEYESGLSDQLSLLLLSNSITLPPGTITVSRHENHFTILAAHTNEKEVRKEVERIEKRLKKFERRN